MKVLLTAALFLCSIATARDLHVDPTMGDDTADGVEKPLKTIRRAIRNAEPGDTIHLKPVVYHEYAGFYAKKGEPGRPITLDGHGATLEGSATIDPTTWKEVAPGLFENAELIPNLNGGVLSRWFFLMDGKMNRMGRVLKGKSEALKKPEDLKPGEWTFVKTEEQPKGATNSKKVRGSFFIKLKEGRKLGLANIRYPVRSAGVQFSGDNAWLVIRNLSVTHPYNDGFNIHGDCRNVVFENITAIECGDDGISAHETAQYSVDGFVSIGNGTGICDTGGSETSYNKLFIADCVGVDLYFLDTGNYSVSNAVVLSSAQQSFVVAGRGDGRCQIKIDNLYLRRIGKSDPAKVTTQSVVTAKRFTLENQDLNLTGEMTFDNCLIKDHATGTGADLKMLIKTVVPESYQSQFR